MVFLEHLGRYFLLMLSAFSKPDKFKIFAKKVVEEIDLIGIGSLPIVAILSCFMGAVMLIQAAYNFSNPLLPMYVEGVATRDTMILEFSPTIISLILAGKVGSSIAGQLGTMKVTEQIDALEIMGVNPKNYLILPKIIASMLIFPFLCIFSIFLGVLGGYMVAWVTDIVTLEAYIYGIQYEFIPFYITYALVKTVFFAFTITSISAYQGYFTRGGALEVGKSSTRAVVYSCVVILLLDLILTQILLNPNA
jgi:phospholipid/cholesterol/gamma-HCH transport system permease protein